MPRDTDFTVIIPTKGRPHLLARALASVLTQTLASFAVIVVDDGDGDGRVVAERLGDPRITALLSNGAGQVASRNLGLARATGRWITFLDDDDWWDGTGHLAALARVLADGATDLPRLAYGSATMVLEDRRSTLDYQAFADWQTIRRDNTILVSSLAYPRALHGRLGLFDADLPYYWDWDWYLRLATASVPFVAAPTNAARISCRPGSVSSAEHEAARRADLGKLREKHHLGELELKNHLSIALERSV